MLNRQRIQITNTLTELARLQAAMQQYFEQHNIHNDIAGELTLVTEELVVNIINYGYEDQLEHTIAIDLVIADQQLSITFIDDAKPFNPLRQDSPELGLPSEKACIGGLGIPLILRLSDQQHYQYKDGYNIFKLSKTITGV